MGLVQAGREVPGIDWNRSSSREYKKALAGPGSEEEILKGQVEGQKKREQQIIGWNLKAINITMLYL